MPLTDIGDVALAVAEVTKLVESIKVSHDAQKWLELESYLVNYWTAHGSNPANDKHRVFDVLLAAQGQSVGISAQTETTIGDEYLDVFARIIARCIRAERELADERAKKIGS